MMLKWGDMQLQSHGNMTILNRRSFWTTHRVWRRPRLKRSSCLVVRNHQLSSFSSSSPSPDNLFHALLPQLNSLDFVAPALGFATALSILYNATRNNSASDRQLPDVIGVWTLFTSPTPFNRFLKLRCAALLSEDAGERLVKEDGHLVSLSTGSIQQIDVNNYAGDVSKKELGYQRICVNTEDGGVVSLDWPANLELTKEYGLDTTILIVPGTADGSMDDNIRSFVYECLKGGCFPIVMNPRGCACSPLITPRLFTAADSDDICTTVQFINRARPWTTLMSAGWGYGANMLTKYLAQVGERTPLTAAICINNPFDLKGVAGPSHLHVDQNLTGGLIDILRSNKELFQGQPKGFDVEKALQSKSLQEFEEAISMVSYGFDSIEDFYVNSSTRDVVGNVKIPLLFIQNDEAVPQFSIPRCLIAENPYTSLLICSCPSFDMSTTAGSWCQHLIIEWLTAVEHGLLKGRHPLLEDTDVTITPLDRLRLMESKASNTSSSHNNLLNLQQLNALNGNTSGPSKEMLKKNDVYLYSRSGNGSQKYSEAENKEIKKDTNGMMTQSNLVDTELIEGGGVNLEDSERGKLLQSTEMVMNMLDVAMPETLSEEQKNKVLTAVGQGETLMNALQDAVPEDVRGKLTSAVTAILEFKNLNISNVSRIPDGTSGLNAKMRENVLQSPEIDLHTSDQNKGDSGLADGSNSQSSKNEASGSSIEPEPPALDNSGKSADSNHGAHTSDSAKVSHDGLEGDNGSAEFSSENTAHSSQYESDSNAKPEVSSKSERSDSSDDQINEQVKVRQEGETAYSDSSDDQISEQVKVMQEGETAYSDKKDGNDNQQNEEKNAQDSTDQKNMSTAMTEERPLPSASSSENQLIEKEDGENQKKEESSAPSVPNLSSSNSPTFGVSQAFNALTGMDDSTQVAVNSVFGVIENMITQLEVNRDNESLVSVENKVENKATDSNSMKPHTSINSDLQQKEDERDNESLVSVENKVENKATDSVSMKPHTSINSDLQQKEDEKRIVTEEPNESSDHQESVSISEHSAERKNEVRVLDKNGDDSPHGIAKLPYGDPLYDQYLPNITNAKNDKSLDLDATTALFLDYIPEEGQWKFLEQSGDGRDYVDNAISHEGTDKNLESPLLFDTERTDNIIEPSYVILDAENDLDRVGEYKKKSDCNEKLDIDDESSGEFMQLVKENIFNSLKVEVLRRVRATDMEDIAPMLAKELVHVVNSISMAIVNGKEHMISCDGEDLVGSRTLQAEDIIEAISSAVQGTKYMRRVIPIGIIVGSTLASLRNFFNIDATIDSRGSNGIVRDQINNSQKKYQLQADRTVSNAMNGNKFDHNDNLYSSEDKHVEKDVSSSIRSDTVMVGAVTAALGASALLVHQEDSCDGLESSRTSSTSFNEKDNQQRLGKVEEEISESSDRNIVTSLAEKAMSVASPVVPTKDGEVDQERLVAMLADLGQKGGILKLVGKIALLWGGIRGAMSLIDKLITFLRFSERPLFQRMLGFSCMVIVLWTPVVVPLLPSLIQNWSAHKSSKIAELTCIVGLYTSIMMLVFLWGKRVRGYEDPLKRYGLELTAKQIQNFICGLIGGVMLVSFIHSINVLLGFVSLSWPTVPSYTDAVTLLKLCGKVVKFIGQSLVIAIGVSLVEELIYRSWLPDEIALDLGYHQGVILSGLAFSLSQRSLGAIPGLWLLSLGLAGGRQRSEGSLSLPIGLRAGMMASSFMLEKGEFLRYQLSFPLWVSGGSYPFQPFTGIVGLAVALLWAIILYPRKQPQTNILKRTIKE